MPSFSDDCYALLGLDAGADAAEVRRAWRRLAVRWHPDRAGAVATATFRKIAAAYAVLSDPVTRAAYDRRKADEDDEGRTGAARAAPGPAPTAEATSTPGSPPTATRRRAPGLMLPRLSGPLNALVACGVARRLAVDVVELLVTGEEAATGGMIAISMRVPVRCARCEGDLERAPGACPACAGAGATDELFSAWLALPPEVADGTVLAPSAQLRGVLRPVSVRVRRA